VGSVAPGWSWWARLGSGRSPAGSGCHPVVPGMIAALPMVWLGFLKNAGFHLVVEEAARNEASNIDEEVV